MPWSEHTIAKQGRRAAIAVSSGGRWRSTYSRAAAWLSLVSPASRVAPGRWNQLGWCRADTLSRRKRGRSAGIAVVIETARFTWCSKERGSVTPKDSSQWLSANMSGSTDPRAERRLKKPVPPTQAV